MNLIVIILYISIIKSSEKRPQDLSANSEELNSIRQSEDSRADPIPLKDLEQELKEKLDNIEKIFLGHPNKLEANEPEATQLLLELEKQLENVNSFIMENLEKVSPSNFDKTSLKGETELIINSVKSLLYPQRGDQISRSTSGLEKVLKERLKEIQTFFKTKFDVVSRPLSPSKISPELPLEQNLKGTKSISNEVLSLSQSSASINTHPEKHQAKDQEIPNNTSLDVSNGIQTVSLSKPGPETTILAKQPQIETDDNSLGIRNDSLTSKKGLEDPAKTDRERRSPPTGSTTELPQEKDLSRSNPPSLEVLRIGLPKSTQVTDPNLTQSNQNSHPGTSSLGQNNNGQHSSSNLEREQNSNLETQHQMSKTSIQGQSDVSQFSISAKSPLDQHQDEGDQEKAKSASLDLSNDDHAVSPLNPNLEELILARQPLNTPSGNTMGDHSALLTSEKDFDLFSETHQEGSQNVLSFQGDDPKINKFEDIEVELYDTKTKKPAKKSRDSLKKSKTKVNDERRKTNVKRKAYLIYNDKEPDDFAFFFDNNDQVGDNPYILSAEVEHTKTPNTSFSIGNQNVYTENSKNFLPNPLRAVEDEQREVYLGEKEHDKAYKDMPFDDSLTKNFIGNNDESLKQKSLEDNNLQDGQGRDKNTVTGKFQIGDSQNLITLKFTISRSKR